VARASEQARRQDHRPDPDARRQGTELRGRRRRQPALLSSGADDRDRVQVLPAARAGGRGTRPLRRTIRRAIATARRMPNPTHAPTHGLVRATAARAASSWPLTAIDRFTFQWVIQGTWVFDARLDATALKHGLARLLDAYPILCGRAAGDRLEWRDRGIP